MTAREILRAEYGDSRNFMTPDTLHRVLIRHPVTGEIGAAEIAEGTGIPTREQTAAGLRVPIVGVSVVWVGADGTRRRADQEEEYGSRLFHSDPTDRPWPFTGDAYTSARRYVRDVLGARLP